MSIEIHKAIVLSFYMCEYLYRANKMLLFKIKNRDAKRKGQKDEKKS